jgi:hypothetical protein
MDRVADLPKFQVPAFSKTPSEQALFEGPGRDESPNRSQVFSLQAAGKRPLQPFSTLCAELGNQNQTRKGSSPGTAVPNWNRA